MDEAALDFASLNAHSAAPACINTFAYWLGVISDPTAQIALDAAEACAIMTHQFDSEEQAVDEAGLRGHPNIIPGILQPIAPVTLALSWSPFPSAIAALGRPVHLHRAEYGQALAVFCPVESPFFPADTPDQQHFLSLLQHCSARAARHKRRVFLTGSPGWSYSSEDLIVNSPELSLLMRAFGFVACARKPARSKP